MLLGIPRGARCVQRFDDSLNSAIHITYRISLRSSSMREPRDPLLKVVINNFINFLPNNYTGACEGNVDPRKAPPKGSPHSQSSPNDLHTGGAQRDGEMKGGTTSVHSPGASDSSIALFFYFNNDPSAGSPTETLLRLLLPLNDQV